MLNVGGWEVLVILLLALIVLGPERLPEAARQVGKMVSTVRGMANGFTREFQEAASGFTDLTEEQARANGRALVEAERAAAQPVIEDPNFSGADLRTDSAPPAATPSPAFNAETAHPDRTEKPQTQPMAQSEPDAPINKDAGAA